MITLDEQSQIQKWLDAEKNGEAFPVDFELAWPMAGYYDKSTAKRRLTNQSSYLTINEDYTIIKGKTILSRSAESELCGRSSDLINLSCDTFKHFCLMAQTAKGREIRQYFIEAEKALKKAIPLCQTLAKENEVLKAKIARPIADKALFVVFYDGTKFLLCTKVKGKVIPLFEQVGPSHDLAIKDYAAYLVELERATLAIQAICDAFNNLSKILTPVH